MADRQLRADAGSQAQQHKSGIKRRRQIMKRKHLLLAVCILATVTAAAHAQEQNVNKEVITIPKEQYQKLLDEHQKLVDEMKEMRRFKAQMLESMKKPAAAQAETEQALDDLEKQLKDVKKMAKDSFPGTSKFLLTGYGSAGFIEQNHGGDKLFSATFNPIFLWKLSDRLLFEGELEAELEGHETHLALEMAHISYVLNDYMTVSG